MSEQTWRNGRTFLGVAIAIMALAASAVTLSAHHGWSTYGTTNFEISGTVESPVRHTGPHSTLTIRVDSEVWDVVLAPTARTERAGLKEGMIPVGARVTASGHRHRDPKKLEIKTERLTWNGRTFNVYPDRD